MREYVIKNNYKALWVEELIPWYGQEDLFCPLYFTAPTRYSKL